MYGAAAVGGVQRRRDGWSKTNTPRRREGCSLVFKERQTGVQSRNLVFLGKREGRKVSDQAKIGWGVEEELYMGMLRIRGGSDSRKRICAVGKKDEGSVRCFDVSMVI